MKQTITGFITYKDYGFMDEACPYHFNEWDATSIGHVTVMPYNIEVDIPDDFDPRTGQVEILKAEKKKLMADFQARCTAIEKQISELTALTCEAA